MTAEAATFTEFEWRSHSIQADAGRIISRLAADTGAGVRHYRVLNELGSVSASMADVLRMFHEAEHIEAFEAASHERRDEMVKQLAGISSTVSRVIQRLRSSDVGYWRTFYNRKLTKLDFYNSQLQKHVQAFEAIDTNVVLLTLVGQHTLEHALEAPAEPNAALRRALVR